MQNVWEDWSFAYILQRAFVRYHSILRLRMQNILKQYEGKNIVIGTHGNIMVLLMNYFNSKYDFEFWKTLHMPDVYKLNFDKNRFISAERIEKTGHRLNIL